MKWQANIVLILLLIVTPSASAQTSTAARGQAQESTARGYWIDPATRLMWAGKDNGKDVSWGKAKKYCRNLRLGGYSDWRLATIEELQGILDKNIESPGLGGEHNDDPLTFNIKGYLFLTGDPWSTSRVLGSDGHPTDHVWYFDFINRYKDSEDGSWFGRGAGSGLRALCVRQQDNQATAIQETVTESPPLHLLASSRTIFVKSNSIWVRRKAIEDALKKHEGFLEMGYAIVKDLAEADLKLQVDHTALTLSYPYTVTHMETQIIVASGTMHSLRILNDVPGDTAGSFVKQAKAARAAVANKPKN